MHPCVLLCTFLVLFCLLFVCFAGPSLTLCFQVWQHRLQQPQWSSSSVLTRIPPPHPTPARWQRARKSTAPLTCWCAPSPARTFSFQTHPLNVCVCACVCMCACVRVCVRQELCKAAATIRLRDAQSGRPFTLRDFDDAMKVVSYAGASGDKQSRQMLIDRVD